MVSQIRRVTIVGGGTAGWLTAGVLASHIAPLDQGGVQVTLVESPDVATIGVGEGTWPSMRSTLQKMGVSETEFIRECSASFKQGSKFVNWLHGQGESYYHPFSVPAGYSELNLVDHWQPFRDEISFVDAVTAQGRLCDNGSAPKHISTPEFAFNLNYGYHLDAAKFAHFLQNHCVNKLGVHHILDHVIGVNDADNGDIKSISTQTNGDLEADLFIDCTGFGSLLLGKHYQVPVRPVNHQLFNDMALAVQVPYQSPDEPITSHTLSTAQSAGWIWNISLPTRRGVGYVFSTAHTTRDHAYDELLAYVGQIAPRVDAQDLTIREIPVRSGYREKFWHKNCLAIGLSAGFVEPLEASALALIEMSARTLAEEFPSTRESMSLVADRFNHRFTDHWQQIIDFLKLHYVLTKRDDSQYWRDNREAISIPESLSASLRLWGSRAPWHIDTPHIDELFPSASFQYVLYGMGYETDTTTPIKRNAARDIPIAQQMFKKNREHTERLLNSLPSNRDLLQKVQDIGFKQI